MIMTMPMRKSSGFRRPNGVIGNTGRGNSKPGQRRCFSGCFLEGAMKNIIFLPQAEQEMIEAALFYDAQSRGLGREFLHAIKKGTNDIAHQPTAYPILRNGIRRKLIRRFPYGILYRDEEERMTKL